MDNICKICGETINERSHWYKTHKLTEKKYFEQYFPRIDLYSKDKIEFKSQDSYFLTDFNNKTNLRGYLELNPKEESLHYLKGWLLRRKQSKNLIFAPSQFEIRSLLFPSISFFHKFYGINSYESICLDIGLKLRYNYNIKPNFSNNPIEIICDTREQKPYSKLELPIKVETLNFADYCPNPNPDNIFIERKEISDWAGVMSKGYSRFERELQRAKDNNAYIIILIEAKYSDLISINYLPQTKWIKASYEYLMKQMRDLYLKFNNFQMVAGGNRNECMKLFNKIVKINNIQQLDIQLLIDNKQIS